MLQSVSLVDDGLAVV